MKDSVTIRFGIDNVLYAKDNGKTTSFVIAVADHKVLYVPSFKCEFGTVSDKQGWCYCLKAEIERKFFRTYTSKSQKFDDLYFEEEDITFEDLETLEKEQMSSDARFKKHSFLKMHEMCNVKIY